jgi:hypothetical protein
MALKRLKTLPGLTFQAENPLNYAGRRNFWKSLFSEMSQLMARKMFHSTKNGFVNY